jgi:hypothetical protein
VLARHDRRIRRPRRFSVRATSRPWLSSRRPCYSRWRFGLPAAASRHTRCSNCRYCSLSWRRCSGSSAATPRAARRARSGTHKDPCTARIRPYRSSRGSSSTMRLRWPPAQQLRLNRRSADAGRDHRRGLPPQQPPRVEEVFYRRWLQTRWESILGRWPAALLASLLWASWHIGIQTTGRLDVDLASVVDNQGVRGLFLGYLWSEYRLMRPILLVHGAINTAPIAIFLLG